MKKLPLLAVIGLLAAGCASTGDMARYVKPLPSNDADLAVRALHFEVNRLKVVKGCCVIMGGQYRGGAELRAYFDASGATVAAKAIGRSVFWPSVWTVVETSLGVVAGVVIGALGVERNDALITGCGAVGFSVGLLQFLDNYDVPRGVKAYNLWLRDQLQLATP